MTSSPFSNSLPAKMKSGTTSTCLLLKPKKRATIFINAESLEKLMNESTIIADKSEFVSEFMEGIDGNPYIIVTLPRKSGKSVLLETVAYFIKDRGLHEAFQATASIWEKVQRVRQQPIEYSDRVSRALVYFSSMFSQLLPPWPKQNVRLEKTITRLKAIGLDSDDSEMADILLEALAEFEECLKRHWKDILTLDRNIRADNSLLPHQLKNRVGAGAQPPPKLKVERDDVFMATYAKRYPVVRIKFTGASGPTFADFVDCLRRRIASEYEIHGYLEWMLAERGDSASKAKLAYFQRIRDADPEKFNLTDLAESIYMLCRFVKWAHGGQPVILLIDEVDAPVNAIVSADCVSKDRESALQLLSDLLTNALKLGTQPTTDDLGPPEVVERALLTGVLPIALHGISSADPGRYHINQIGNLQASADPVPPPHEQACDVASRVQQTMTHYCGECNYCSLATADCAIIAINTVYNYQNI